MPENFNPCSEKEARKEWNRRAREMDFFSDAPSTIYYKKAEIRLFEEFFKGLKGRKILKSDLWNEVNNTRILEWAGKKGARVCGIDISDYLVSEAGKNLEKQGIKTDFRCCDIRKIKFPDNSFDFVYSMGTIEHMPDHDKAVAELARVLKPGGTAIIGVPNRHDPFLRPVMVWLLDVFGKYPYSPEKSFSMQELKKEIEKTGLKVKDTTGILFMPGVLRIADMFFYKRARPLCALTGALLKAFEMPESKSAWFRRRGYLIACVATKEKAGK